MVCARYEYSYYNGYASLSQAAAAVRRMLTRSCDLVTYPQGSVYPTGLRPGNTNTRYSQETWYSMVLVQYGSVVVSMSEMYEYWNAISTLRNYGNGRIRRVAD